ncbi:TPA: hypothetical protein ACHJ6T_004913, partial [Escherichia coli]
HFSHINSSLTDNKKLYGRNCPLNTREWIFRMKLRTASDTLPPSGANPIVTGKYGLRGAKIPARK